MRTLLMTLALVLCAAAPPPAQFDASLITETSWTFASPSGDLSDQPSGLAASVRNPGAVVWEDEAPRNGRGMLYVVTAAGLQRRYWFSPTGKDRPRASMLDFEDMAAGPCDGPGSGTCWWVGDIGRQSRRFLSSAKNTFWLYRIPEPDIETTPDGSELPVTGRFPVTLPAAVAKEGRLPGGSVSGYDMETLMVHPKTGAIYLVTKGQNTAGKIRIMQYPGALAAGSPKQVQIVKTFQMPRWVFWTPGTQSGQGYHLVTGGDINPDGRRFALRTYGWIWEFRGATWNDALASTTPVRLPRSPGSLDQQGEAFCYSTNGSQYFTLGERSSTTTRTIVVYSRKVGAAL